MNFKEIEDLLEKYFDGKTTLAEEKQLREYFNTEEIPPHLAVHADLFRYFAIAGKEEITDPEFEEKFLSSISETPVIPLYSRKKRLAYIMGIAAGVLLLVGLFFTFREEIFRKSASDTYSDPALAYAEARKALLMVSVNLNTGLDRMQHLSNFEKGIVQMQKFSQFNKYQPLIINPGDLGRLQNHQ